MDTDTSYRAESLVQNYESARKGGNVELALQIAFRLEDAKRGNIRTSAALNASLDVVTQPGCLPGNA